jgi:predicted DNA-binding transcriptional regulator AlpA
MDDYLTTKQVAELLGVQPKTVRQYLWRERDNFPEPDERVGPLPLWKKETIEKWRKQRASATWNRKK